RRSELGTSEMSWLRPCAQLSTLSRLIVSPANARVQRRAGGRAPCAPPGGGRPPAIPQSACRPGPSACTRCYAADVSMPTSQVDIDRSYVRVRIGYLSVSEGLTYS